MRFGINKNTCYRKIEKVEMLSNYEFVFAGYDLIQTRYSEDCLGARVVSNDLLFTEICRPEGRVNDDRNYKIYENLRKLVEP